VTFFALNTSLSAGLVVNVGSHLLQPDQANQTITLNLTGAVNLAGLDFRAQVEDGASGPKITGVDLVTGTLFAANNSGPGSLQGGSWTPYRSVTTSAGTVSGDGVLATLTVDTTGITSGGTWSLLLSATANGPTEFLDGSVELIPATITDGSMTVVPEPASMAVVGSLLLGGAWLIRRRTA
jgi:hypothetical protein